MLLTHRAIRLSYLLAGSLVLLVGCSGSQGDRCQRDSDCGSGLTCSTKSPGNGVCSPKITPGAGGSTGQTSSTPTVTPDAGVKSDTSADQSGELSPVTSDASPDEAVVVDAGAKVDTATEASTDLPALAVDAASDRPAPPVDVVFLADTAVDVSIDAADVAVKIDAAIDSAPLGADVSPDSLLTE
jgi:hypothetical protein